MLRHRSLLRSPIATSNAKNASSHLTAILYRNLLREIRKLETFPLFSSKSTQPNSTALYNENASQASEKMLAAAFLGAIPTAATLQLCRDLNGYPKDKDLPPQLVARSLFRESIAACKHFLDRFEKGEEEGPSSTIALAFKTAKSKIEQEYLQFGFETVRQLKAIETSFQNYETFLKEWERLIRGIKRRQIELKDDGWSFLLKSRGLQIASALEADKDPKSGKMKSDMPVPSVAALYRACIRGSIFRTPLVDSDETDEILAKSKEIRALLTKKEEAMKQKELAKKEEETATSTTTTTSTTTNSKLCRPQDNAKEIDADEARIEELLAFFRNTDAESKRPKEPKDNRYMDVGYHDEQTLFKEMSNGFADAIVLRKANLGSVYNFPASLTNAQALGVASADHFDAGTSLLVNDFIIPEKRRSAFIDHENTKRIYATGSTRDPIDASAEEIIQRLKDSTMTIQEYVAMHPNQGWFPFFEGAQVASKLPFPPSVIHQIMLAQQKYFTVPLQSFNRNDYNNNNLNEMLPSAMNEMPIPGSKTGGVVRISSMGCLVSLERSDDEAGKEERSPADLMELLQGKKVKKDNKKALPVRIEDVPADEAQTFARNLKSAVAIHNASSDRALFVMSGRWNIQLRTAEDEKYAHSKINPLEFSNPHRIDANPMLGVGIQLGREMIFGKETGQRVDEDNQRERDFHIIMPGATLQWNSEDADTVGVLKKEFLKWEENQLQKLRQEKAAAGDSEGKVQIPDDVYEEYIMSHYPWTNTTIGGILFMSIPVAEAVAAHDFLKKIKSNEKSEKDRDEIEAYFSGSISGTECIQFEASCGPILVDYRQKHEYLCAEELTKFVEPTPSLAPATVVCKVPQIDGETKEIEFTVPKNTTKDSVHSDQKTKLVLKMCDVVNKKVEENSDQLGGGNLERMLAEAIKMRERDIEKSKKELDKIADEEDDEEKSEEKKEENKVSSATEAEKKSTKKIKKMKKGKLFTKEQVAFLRNKVNEKMKEK